MPACPQGGEAQPDRKLAVAGAVVAPEDIGDGEHQERKHQEVVGEGLVITNIAAHPAEKAEGVQIRRQSCHHGATDEGLSSAFLAHESRSYEGSAGQVGEGIHPFLAPARWPLAYPYRFMAYLMTALRLSSSPRPGFSGIFTVPFSALMGS